MILMNSSKQSHLVLESHFFSLYPYNCPYDNFKILDWFPLFLIPNHSLFAFAVSVILSNLDALVQIILNDLNVFVIV